MSSEPPLVLVRRLFVPPDSLAGGRLRLAGPDSARLHGRGARAGDTVVVLDDSGWEMAVLLDACGPDESAGRVVGRSLAGERRTKVELYHGLLHPADARRLLVRATGLGIVAYVPLVTDTSVIPPSGMLEHGEGDWAELVRDAAEESRRGRRPLLRSAMLLDHALDEAQRVGSAMMIDPSGADLDEALAGRPFQVSLVCPPPGGFTADEVARARARGLAVARGPEAGRDPVRRTAAVLVAVYDRLEPGDEA